MVKVCRFCHGVASRGAHRGGRITVGVPAMRYRALIVPAVAASAVLVGAGPASAHSVGEPGTPNCFGQRISHGSSVHGLTPKERAAGLQELVDSGFPEAVAFFGPTVSVREMTMFVRINCSDNPIVS